MDYTKNYADFLGQFNNIKRPLKIVCDASNGAAGVVLNKLVPLLSPAEIIILNAEPNGDFPAHGPNPLIAGATDEISKKVVESNADIGAIFDADGDRVFFIDENGKMLPSFVIAALLFKNSRPPFVADELVYHALNSMKLFGENELFASRVGVFFIKQAMKRVNATHAAEFSGHYYFEEFFGVDSGIYALIQIINLLSAGAPPLSQLISELPTHAVKNVDLKIEGKNWPDIEKRVLDAYSKPSYIIGHRDGITVEMGDSWLNVRPSNTEPIVRIYAGAPKESDALTLIDDVKKLV